MPLGRVKQYANNKYLLDVVDSIQNFHLSYSPYTNGNTCTKKECGSCLYSVKHIVYPCLHFCLCIILCTGHYKDILKELLDTQTELLCLYFHLHITRSKPLHITRSKPLRSKISGSIFILFMYKMLQLKLF